MSMINEQLESRRLMSVSLAYDPATSALEVIGGRTGDDIRVSVIGPEKRVIASASDPQSSMPNRTVPVLQGVSVFVDHVMVFNSLLAGVRVASVDVYGNDGSDTLTIWTQNTQTLTRVFGGPGADSIYTSAENALSARVEAEDGPDFIQSSCGLNGIATNIDAGDGDDTIEILRVAESAGRNNAIFGGAGNDEISLSVESGTVGCLVMAGDGNDTIHGSAMNDELYGEAGQDIIYGGAGDDYLNGGTGDDQLFGEDGDDFLDNSAGGIDVLNGGSGHDSASSFDGDKLVDVEELVWAV